MTGRTTAVALAAEIAALCGLSPTVVALDMASLTSVRQATQWLRRVTDESVGFQYSVWATGDGRRATGGGRGEGTLRSGR